MTRIPRPLIKLLRENLHDGEVVLWQGRPHAWADLKLMAMSWWVGVPWLALASLATYMGWIDEGAFPCFMVGAGIMAIPVVFFVHDLQTLFVITNRRALTLQVTWVDRKRTVESTYYEAMDKEPEIVPIRGDVGHLNFSWGAASPGNRSDRKGFRCVKSVEKVRDLLAGAIAKYA